jgi:hypothetical protein
MKYRPNGKYVRRKWRRGCKTPQSLGAASPVRKIEITAEIKSRYQDLTAATPSARD